MLQILLRMDYYLHLFFTFPEHIYFYIAVLEAIGSSKKLLDLSRLGFTKFVLIVLSQFENDDINLIRTKQRNQ